MLTERQLEICRGVAERRDFVVVGRQPGGTFTSVRTNLYTALLACQAWKSMWPAEACSVRGALQGDPVMGIGPLKQMEVQLVQVSLEKLGTASESRPTAGGGQC
jgi:hypothetical protein